MLHHIQLFSPFDKARDWTDYLAMLRQPKVGRGCLFKADGGGNISARPAFFLKKIKPKIRNYSCTHTHTKHPL